MDDDWLKIEIIPFDEQWQELFRVEADKIRTVPGKEVIASASTSAPSAPHLPHTNSCG